MLAIVAWGGVGKTALVSEGMSRMAGDEWRGAERVFDWSFYSQGTRAEGDSDKTVSADMFIAAASTRKQRLFVSHLLSQPKKSRQKNGRQKEQRRMKQEFFCLPCFCPKQPVPIETSIPLHPVSQSEFGQVAYEVVGHAFAIHKRLGRIFDESVYRKTLAHILTPRAAHEVCIRLTHADFEKLYFMDLVVNAGSPFELKVASAIHQRHRQQLIQYLMLTDLRHGKVINFGADRVEHEFVNCHETTEHRRSFQVDLSRWSSQAAGARRFQEIVVDLLRDWGTGLDRGLYIEAVTHFLGGPDVVRQPIETLWSGIVVGRQNVNLAAANTGFEITCLRPDAESYEENLLRFLANTTLDRILWVNVVSGDVGFVLLSK